LKIILRTLKKQIVVPIRTVIFACESDAGQVNKNEKHQENFFHLSSSLRIISTSSLIYHILCYCFEENQGPHPLFNLVRLFFPPCSSRKYPAGFLRTLAIFSRVRIDDNDAFASYSIAGDAFLFGVNLFGKLSLG